MGAAGKTRCFNHSDTRRYFARTRDGGRGVSWQAQYLLRQIAKLLRFLALVALLVSPVHAQSAWRNVPGAELRAMFIDHELADGVHYAYQFRADGTFAGFSMGKEIHGTWRSNGKEFCWMQSKLTAEEECFEVERRGREVRFLRDGYEVLAARLSAIKTEAAKEKSR